MKLRIRIQGFLIFSASILCIVFYEFFIPDFKVEVWDELSDGIGLVIVLTGFFIRISARGTKADSSAQSQKLCTTGLYRLVRNPMYLGTFFIGFGIVMMIAQWWIVLIFLMIWFFIFGVQIRKEEVQLSSKFGDLYNMYFRKTGRIFPKIKAVKNLNNFNWLPCKWAWIKRELPSIAGTLALIFFMEIWEDYLMFKTWEIGEELKEFSVILIGFIVVAVFVEHKTSYKNIRH